MAYNWYKNLWPVNEYENDVFVLGGNEGTRWEDMKINDVKESPIKVYLKVVGFRDERASFRNWGHTTTNKYVEEPKIVTRYKYRERVKPLQVIKTPKTLLEKLLSKLGFFRII